MGLVDDLKQIASVSGDVIRRPGEFLRELKFLAEARPENYYDFLGDDVLEAQDGGFEQADKPLWLNLGYWKDAHTYPDACANMARLVADTAAFHKTDLVVDVGFGFGEQDLLWNAEYDVAKIVGLNVTRLHVEVGQKRVADRGLSERIDLRLGSATEMPLDDASADKVVALESAFHFDTREKFFDEAMRVLKPGGRLVTADMVPHLGEKPGGLANWLGWRRWGVPPANIYDREACMEKLRARGFEHVSANSIRNYVFPGMHRYAEQRKNGVAMKDIAVQLTTEEIEACRGVEVWAAQGGLTDYVIFSADKPGPSA